VDLTFLAIPMFQRALVAALTLSVMLAFLGTLVTARGLAYLGDGLSHAAFGGIALGMFLGLSQPLWIALPFTALAAIAIGALRRKSGMRIDVAMAVLFALCFSVGVILLRKTPRRAGVLDPEQLLFGNILLIGQEDLWIVLGIFAATALFLAFAWTRLAYATFDEDLARLSGVDAGVLENVLLGLLAAVIVVAIRLAGVVLVSAFLVIPAATGRGLARRFGTLALIAAAVGVLGVLLGFVLAQAFEWPEGASIVCSMGILFLIGSALSLALKAPRVTA
jgi:zinc transport system permease protein